MLRPIYIYTYDYFGYECFYGYYSYHIPVVTMVTNVTKVTHGSMIATVV